MSENYLNDKTLKGYTKDSKNQYSKLVGKDVLEHDLVFYVEYKADWDSEMGQCYEFRLNNSKLLLAYCVDANDFDTVLKSFNV